MVVRILGVLGFEPGSLQAQKVSELLAHLQPQVFYPSISTGLGLDSRAFWVFWEHFVTEPPHLGQGFSLRIPLPFSLFRNEETLARAIKRMRAYMLIKENLQSAYFQSYDFSEQFQTQADSWLIWVHYCRARHEPLVLWFQIRTRGSPVIWDHLGLTLVSKDQTFKPITKTHMWLAGDSHPWVTGWLWGSQASICCTGILSWILWTGTLFNYADS